MEYYKLAQLDGYDFYTGKTINYRGEGKFPHTVSVPKPNTQRGVCSSGVIHASSNPNDCFIGARIPCSAYRVRGKPVCGDTKKYGFLALEVIEEIFDLDTLFGWRYSEAVSPINPFSKKHKPTKRDLELLKLWASVEDSVWDSVEDSVRVSVWASVRVSVGDSVWVSVWAYIGSFFTGIKKWKYISHKEGEYPFQSAVDLWRCGLVPSFDGKLWRLHSGKNARIVWEGEL